MPWFDPAYALSIGNQIDLTAADLLQHIKNDPQIDVFAVYMEGFKPGDGLVFAQAVRDTVALGKDAEPVLFSSSSCCHLVRPQVGRPTTPGWWLHQKRSSSTTPVLSNFLTRSCPWS